MVTILVVGLFVWVLSGAVEDTIKAARGDAPRSERRGLRGYLDDRWQALADHHHAVAASGLLTRGDARLARKHLARTKALKLAGFATDEDVAKAKAEHQHRLGFIAQGIDPDTLPPLFPVRGQVWEPPTEPKPVVAEEPEPEPTEAAPEPTAEPGVAIDGHFYDNVQVWLNPEFFPPEPATPETDPTPEPEDTPWSPYAPSNTDTKETHVVTAREITSPAAVKQFHDDLKAVIDATTATADTLEGRAAELQTRASEVAGNISATEYAAADMRTLGMHDAAAAAEALMETQQAIYDALTADAKANREHAATITDQAAAAQGQLAAILAAHDGQLAVQEARAAAGRGNLAADNFLDND